jgi:hypothetical protein
MLAMTMMPASVRPVPSRPRNGDKNGDPYATGARNGDPGK